MNSEKQHQARYIPPSRRRDKPILSCSLCRRRKLKCDRQQPCKACEDRGLSLSCTYSRNASTPSASSASTPPINVHDRIDHLEKLVTTLMEAKGNGDCDTRATLPTLGPSSHPKPNDPTADAEAPGTPVHMTLDSEETTYIDSGHWRSILDSISELKDELDQIPTDPQQPEFSMDITAGPDLLFGDQRHATRQDLIAALPSKAESDQFLANYWQFVDVAPTIMHKPKFEREYEEFWRNPSNAPIMWLGQLYGIYAIATRIQSLVEEYDGGIPDPSLRTFSEARQDLYRHKVAQCLILANYSKCPPYTMETFISYFAVEYLRSRETQHGTWLLVGIIVRTAFRMGLHREPSKLAKLTPFECEMRRRMWSMILRLDLMSSGQVGLPRMIHPMMTDTLEPGNFTDDDLHEDLAELPPSRPDTEFTPMLYTIVRNRVLVIFARIVDLVNGSEQPKYREVMKLDGLLKTTYDNLPEPLKGSSAKDSIMDRDSMTMSVLILTLTFLKASLMLHRPFLFLARTDSRYEYSRIHCVDAALEMLEFRYLLESQSTDIKQFWATQSLWWTSSWRLSSLMTHDFLLATTLLALDLDRDLINPVPESDAPRIRLKSGQPTRAEIIQALTKINDLWSRASSKSREAQRVAAAVRHVLRKANANEDSQIVTPNYTPPQPELSWPPQQEATTTSYFFDPSNPQAGLSFPMDDMQMDFGGSFDWAGFESGYPIGEFGQNMQNSYFG